MSFDEVLQRYWEVLHSELQSEELDPTKRPLLAHYTSLANLESILSNGQLWLSNPLFMNDVEEVRFGVTNGLEIVQLHQGLRDALGAEHRRHSFFSQLDREFNVYGNEDVLDLYVICFSIHENNDIDGKLSMWRGYGKQGKGAALVIDTAMLPVPENFPLALAPVTYATQDERRQAIRDKVDEVCEFIKSNIVPDEFVAALAAALFKRICLFALFSKHKGFLEEQEWRLVYFKDRDIAKSFNGYFDYFNGPDGIQPKLKLPIQEVGEKIQSNFDFARIVHSIIVGPSVSSPLSKLAMDRMLDKIGCPNLKQKVKMSGIPFRG